VGAPSKRRRATASGAGVQPFRSTREISALRCGR
jgi:hypothetical protein